MDNTVIYVNPRSGSGRALVAWRGLEKWQPQLATARLVLTDSAAEALAELEHRLAAGARRVIAIGGDGTAHLVASCLLRSGLGQLYRGTHLLVGGVLAGRGREVRIIPAAALPPFDLDGESHPSAAATFDILPGALRLLV